VSARTDALMSRAETGKMSAASIVPVISGCHPAVPQTKAAFAGLVRLHWNRRLKDALIA
jgi:hypothetical protein